MGAHHAVLAEGKWHFQHGPMDVVLQIEGEATAVQRAHDAAWRRFESLLSELVLELPQLRRTIALSDTLAASGLQGETARLMFQACQGFRADFITPMAAVAGAVAQTLIDHCRGPGVRRAWANNGGDIALHLMPGESCRVGLFADIARFSLSPSHSPAHPELAPQDLDATFEVHAELPVRGIATSGWRGRSFSLGIADSVTVLARSAALADAAATMIANAVNVEHPGIARLPANQCSDDSDLGHLLVTRDVPRLPDAVVAEALQKGFQKACAFQQSGLVFAAVLCCQGQTLQTGISAARPAIALAAD